MIKSISSRVSQLLSAMCLLAAFLVILTIAEPTYAQSAQTPATVKAGRSTERSSDKDDKSEREKRDELGRKLERRRDELNAIPVNNLVPAHPVKQESAPASSEGRSNDKAKEKKSSEKN